MEEDDADTLQNLPVVTPGDVIALSLVTDVLMLVGTQERKKVTKMAGMEHLTDLKELVLRSCLISKMENLDTMIFLERLELYDNQITALDCMQSLSNLVYVSPISLLTASRVLDMSFNLIRDMAPISTCRHLEEIYLAQNKIREIHGLESMENLVKLDLGANRIRKIENLSFNVSLQEVWMGKNKITVLEGLDTLINLRRLDLQANRLGGNPNVVEINSSQLQFNSRLQELFLNENEIYDLSSFPSLTQLTTLDLSHNHLTCIPHAVVNSSQLSDLWMSYNDVTGFDDYGGGLANVSCVYFEGNPISKSVNYISIIKSAFPGVTQIDANMILK